MTVQLWTTEAAMAPQVETMLPETPSRPADQGRRPRQIPESTDVIRIGAVSYLNSKPLVEDLVELLPDADVSLDYPSRLADDLASGNIDVGLIPSVECMRDPDYEIISDACVATRGPVLSVKLYTRTHPGNVRTLALDEGSRTSAALARILLQERFGVDPERRPLSIGQSVQDTDADAILMIGDRAMHSPGEKFHSVWDLGEEWLHWTGLPFVFAMWVSRKGVATPDVEAMLGEARNRGESRLREIAARESEKLGVSVEECTSYLTDNLHFRLTSAERSGLKLFQELAVQNGLAPEGVNLVFRDNTAAR